MSLSAEDMKKVGGSDVAAIMGMDPRRSPLSVWTRIVHGVDTPDNPAMRRGRVLEPAVLDWYEQETGRSTVRGPSVIIPDARWRCSLDAKSYGAEAGPKARVVEVKTTGRNGVNGWGEPGTDEVPDGYALQVQWYLGWGLRAGKVQDTQADVAVLLAGDFALYHVHFNAEVFGVLEDRATRFWQDHVETGRPPDAAPTTQDTALVARIRRIPGHAAVPFAMLTLEAQEAVRDHLRREWQMREMKRMNIESRTRAMLAVSGAGGVAGLPEDTGYSRIEWSTRKGRTTTDWEAVARGMLAPDADALLFEDLVQTHTTTSEPTRAWCPKPLKEPEE